MRIIANRPNFRLRLLVYFTIDQLTGRSEVVVTLTARRSDNHRHTQLISITTQTYTRYDADTLARDIVDDPQHDVLDELAERLAERLGLSNDVYGPAVMIAVLQTVWCTPAMTHQEAGRTTRDITADHAELVLFGSTIPAIDWCG